ncbi:MAG: hypothetical protein AB8G95_13150 [Anaerolineae bacterium]
MPNKHLISNLLVDWNGYAQINAHQIIETADPVAQRLSATPDVNIVSQKACDAFLELMGCESALAEILSGELPYLEFVQINRSKITDTPNFFDFKIIPVDSNTPALGAFLLIRKSTIEG